MNYIFIDEIQLIEKIDTPYLKSDSKIGFVDVLIGLMKIRNINLYVTGSNSKMLSTDILTEFKDRSEEIRIHPLSYKECYACFEDKQNVWREYFNYGGMPRLVAMSKHEEKRQQEIKSLLKINDSFKKVVIVK